MTSPLPAPPGDLDPDHITQVASTFMSAKLLCVASEIGVFEKLGDGPLTLDELSAATGLPRRSARVVANVLAAIGVLERRGEHYQNGPHAQAFLAGQTSVDLRAGLRLFDKIIYPMFMQFERAVRTGEPVRHAGASEEFAKIFSEGVEAWTGVSARALPKVYDFSTHRRLLDVGGGTGSFLVEVLERFPGLHGTLYELPPSAAIAKGQLAGHAVKDRIAIEEGDVLFDPIPGGHDVALLAAFIHLFSPDRVVMILRRLREVLAPGARLLIVDQWMNATHTSPVLGAVLGATYLMLSGDADTYSVEEAEPWLEQSGFRMLEHRALAGMTSLLICEAI